VASYFKILKGVQENIGVDTKLYDF